MLVATILFMWVVLISSPTRAEAYAFTPPLLKASLTPLPTLTPNSQLIHGNSNGIDLSNFGPLIAFAGVILAALIAFGGVVYQSRRTARIEKEKLAVQVELERERIRFQDEINAARAAQERQRQRSEMDAQDVLAAMDRAKNITERDQAYRDSLKADPRIARLQILDMSHPLDVAKVFVRVRLHQETKPSYELDQNLLEAEALRDPNELLRVGSIHLEHRVSSALDPDEAIRTYKRCVFVGDPGAGKTTLLKYLTLKAAEKQLTNLPDLPIHIELNAFASSQCQDLLDFASIRWEDRYGFPRVDARTYMEEKLKTGSALLLLDALDETVIGDSVDEAEASYKRAIDDVMQVATRYHRSPVVVTARKAGYQQRTRLDGFTELEVLDFRPEDIEQFVRNWFAGSPSLNQYVSAANLNAKLARNPRLRTLAANPLLLSLIVIVYEDQLDLPDRRAELYRQCVDTLLTKWDTSRDIRRRREFKPEHKRQLLEEVAWRFHNQGKRYVPESELLSHIESFLPAIGLPSGQSIRILEEITAENGLLKEQARHWYGFLHLTLQEYFVAQHIAKHGQFEKLLIHLGDPWWEEVLLLYAGLTPDASPLLQQLTEPDNYTFLQEDVFHTRLLFAGQCLAARPTIRQLSLREDILSRLFKVLTDTPYLLTREQISSTLAEIGGMEINTHLVYLLADDKQNITVRLYIADALGKLGERTVAPELVRLLADDKENMDVREAIAGALGGLGERTVAPELVRLLADDKLYPIVRKNIARVLGVLGERTVVPELIRLVANDKLNRDVRMVIVTAALEKLAYDIASVLSLSSLLQVSDLRSTIHSILWTVSRRARVSVFITYVNAVQKIEIVEWNRR
jgi:NACHT domain/HEAT repeats